ncbi:MAG TPA: DUF2752 domain-containing protein [Hungateiclostridium thermocellum]|jgi:hypothetical protein|nr:DUF2752 domain-containing protein [Acetivibrio thermocellus]ADU73667.1 hypothetical protein Clo1313_0585 [Acetivibrio thermocellus DSM 1313]ALX07596.1 Protein of unknown function DUF2752 [Acetivibrio thermocellus AD2]ANV75336.1 Protein of unknown function DUF2752 [Acetivibrio thermocellus DSM 2360]CDG37520.1 hypothetical protein CTHBC1_2948 [Acetivibrio thermocellus BC1]EIC03482.1 hypothetical protein YSBL_2797 [Acetivibrio thermocellus YS]
MAQTGAKRYFKNFSNEDFILHLSILLLCFFPVVLSFLMVTNGKATAFKLGGYFFKIGLPCIFKAATGYNCPACGMTRSFIYMSDLNISAAWAMNRAGVLLYLFCLLQIPYRFMLIFNRKIPFQRIVTAFGIVFLIVVCFVTVGQFVFQFF